MLTCKHVANEISRSSTNKLSVGTSAASNMWPPKAVIKRMTQHVKYSCVQTSSMGASEQENT